MQVLSFFQSRSYADMFPDLDILREENVFIEVGYYTLRIPIKPENNSIPSVDIFAETVLRLLALDRHYTEEQIAEKMCVSTDFIRCILSRLRGQRILDSGNKIVRNTASPSDVKQSANNPPIEQRHAFFIRATGDFLSCLTKQLFYEDNITEGQKIKIFLGTSGNARTVTGIRLRSNKTDKKISSPPRWPSLISSYNKHLTALKAGASIHYLEGSHIEAQKCDQRILLHCKIAIQNGNSDDFIISDGFSIHSPALHDYVSTCQTKLIENLFEKASISSANGYDQAGDPDKNNYGRKSDKLPYWEIRDRLNNLGAFRGTTVDEIKNAEKANSENLRRLSEAVEWAFFYYVKDNPPAKELLDSITSQTPTENYSMFSRIMKQRGIAKLPQNLFGSLNTSRFKRCWDNGEPDLCVLLPLALMSPTLFLDSHKLKLINELYSHAKGVRHEAGTGIAPDDFNRYLENALSLIRTLLPRLQLQNAGRERVINNATQHRINAKTSLAKAIGWNNLQQLTPELLEELLSISPGINDNSRIPNHEFIFSCSRSLEYSFKYAMHNAAKVTLLPKKDILGQISADLNLIIPPGITMVDEHYLSRALNGEDSTLNGLFVAFLYRFRKRPDEIKDFISPETLDLITTLSRVRGHTAKAALSVSDEELVQFRDRIFTLIPKLLTL